MSVLDTIASHLFIGAAYAAEGAQGMTMILVTHEMGFARNVATKIVFMHQGRVWEEGPPDRIFGDPQTAELKSFIGSVQ